MRSLCRNAAFFHRLRIALPPSEWRLHLYSMKSSFYEQHSGKTFNSSSAAGYFEKSAGDETGATDVPLSGAVHASSLSLKPQVVIYDGVCHLCHAGVKWVIEADKHKKISFCALQSELAEPYLFLCGLSREDVLNRFLFVEGPGQFSQASTAALRVASYLPLPYSALSAFLVIPTPLRDAIYDYIAKRRYEWFGQSTKCILPDDDILDRFIDREELVEKYGQQEQE